MRLAVVVALALSTPSFAQAPFTPARLVSGDAPALPVETSTGGQVLVEAAVDLTGSVSGVTVLRTTPPFDEAVIAAVHGWRFSPAEVVRADGTRGATGTSVLVAAILRPPTLLNGPTAGEPPTDVKVPSERVPFPTGISVPPFPPLALAGGVVMLEVDVRPDGSVGRAVVTRSGPGFDSAAIDAIRRWTFRPARLGGTAVSSVAYVIFGFSQPIIVLSPENQRR
jgi:TonB family protein